MGDLLQSLGTALGIPSGNKGVNPLDVLAGNGGIAGPLGDVVGINGPMAPPSGRFPQGTLSSGETPSGVPAEVAEGVVSGWKPKKQSFLGALADQYLMANGMRPAFRDRMLNRNIQHAMEGFTQEPLEAVRRLAQIDGLGDKAWTLYNQIIDNQRAQGTLDRQNKLIDMKNDEYAFNQTASMMSAANPDTWTAMRNLAIKRGQDRGVDVSHLIPEEYDPDSIQFMMYGGTKPKDLLTLDERRKNNEARVGLGRDRLNESIRNHDLQNEDRDDSEDIRRTAPSRQNGQNLKAKFGGRAYKDSNGTLVEFDSDGTKIKATKPNGGIDLYRMGVDGKPVKVKSYATKEEYEAALAATKGK